MLTTNSGPLTPSPSLASRLIVQIRAEIVQGNLRVGSQLPTEAQLMRAFGVSRTVVREAVAALRAEGFVTTRQGRGAFVAASGTRMPFRVTPEEASSLEDILMILELRATLEVDAAGIAATRRSDADLDRIGRALADLESQIEACGDSIEADFRFHMAVADASGNAYFGRVLQSLGDVLIPRRRIAFETPALRRSYLQRVQVEHRAIEAALIRGDARAARKAMEKHLSGARYRFRLQVGAAEDAPAEG